VHAGVGEGVGVTPAGNNPKLVLEMSKNMLPTASILMRQVALVIFGMVTLSLPSFGTLAAKIVENVLPPSDENEILTFAAFTGALLVFATSHVTVCVEPDG